MNKIVESIDAIQKLSKNKTAVEVLREVFYYPDKKILRVYYLKLRNELQLNESLTKDEKDTIQKFLRVLEILLNAKEIDTTLKLSEIESNQKLISDSNAELLRALDEIEPQIKQGEYFKVAYQNGRLVATTTPEVQYYTRVDEYLIDNLAPIKNILIGFDASINTFDSLIKSGAKTDSTFKYLLLVLNIRRQVLDSLKKKIKTSKEITKVKISIDRGSLSVDEILNDYEVEINISKVRNHQEYNAVVTFKKE